MALVTFDPGTRTWLLRTLGAAYALRWEDGDGLRHLHWAAPLHVEEAARLSVHESPGSSFDSRAGDEFPGEDGARFGVPSLQVRHADRSRGTHWELVGHRIEDGELQIFLRDSHYPLELDLHYRVHDDSEVLERWATLRNAATVATTVEAVRLDSAFWTIPPLDDYRLSHVVGDWAGEFQVQRATLPVAETTLTSRRGITSHQTNPWVMIDDGTATEETGRVWSAALAWSGSWRITLERTPTGRLYISGGAGHEGLSTTLRAGEERRTPVFAALYTAGGFGAASRAWHHYIARHVLPRPQELRPVIYNSWEATAFEVTVDNQTELATRAAALGVELFVVDDGWFGARRSDEAGLGDWAPSPQGFPQGLGPLVAEVRRLGMKFGLWVEPEMVNPASDLYRLHPDWVLHTAHRQRTLLRKQLVLNFARPDVAQWAYAWLDALVAEHRIDYLKWDMNRAFTEAGWPTSTDPDRLWFNHIRNVQSIMGRLREAHPYLSIETCAGGGGRVDLAALAHSEQAWTSDNTDAHDRVTIQYGYSQLYPARTMAAWVTDSPNPFTGRSLPLAFRFHIAMAGVLGIGGDLTRWTAAELAEAAELVQQYKDIRPVVQRGSLHRLQDAVQYTLGDRIVVIAWKLPAVSGAPTSHLRLAGLRPGARYLDETSGQVHTGDDLISDGLTVGLDQDWDSRVITLRCMK